MNERTNERTNKRTNDQTNERTNEQTNDQTNDFLIYIAHKNFHTQGPDHKTTQDVKLI